MSWQNRVFVVLLWPLIGLQKQVHSFSTQNLRTASQRFPALCRLGPCCSSSWPIYSSREKFWPTSENRLCLQIQFWFPLQNYLVGSWLWLITRAQFWCALESSLSDQMIFHLLAKCTHDIVRILQCLLSWTTVRHQPLSSILHQYKFLSIDLVVLTFQFVLYTFAIEILHLQDHHSKVCLSWLHLARTMDTTGLPVLSWQDSYSSHISATAP